MIIRKDLTPNGNSSKQVVLPKLWLDNLKSKRGKPVIAVLMDVSDSCIRLTPVYERDV